MIVRELIALFGFKVDKKTEQGVSNTFSKLRKAAGVLAAVLITGKLAQGFVSLITAASDAEEVTNKLGAVFGDLTADVENFADTTSTRIGQSRTTIQSFSADIGALVKPLLGSNEAAAKMAKGVTELAFDIASFQNLRPEEALAKLRAGLVGSSEPLLTLGVDTRVAALEQFRLDEGIKQTVKSMTAAQVTTLRYQLIVKRLGEQGAVGDATKTADGFANASRGVAGALVDLKADIGKIFLPAATDVVVAVRDMARELSEPLVRGAKVALAIFRGLGTILRTIAIGWKSVADIVAFAAEEFLGVNQRITQVIIGLTLLVAILGLPVVLLGLIAAAIFLVIDDLIAMGEGGESVIGGLILEFQRFVDELGSVGAAIREILTTAIVFWFDVSKEQVDAFVDNVMATLGGIWDDIVTLWTADLDEFFQFMFQRFKVIGDFIAGIFGDEENVARIEAVTKAATPGAAAGPGAVGAGAGVGPLVEPQFPIPGGSSVVLTQEGNNIELNISGVGSPEQVGSVAAVKVDEVLERRQRQAMQQLTTAGSTT